MSSSKIHKKEKAQVVVDLTASDAEVPVATTKKTTTGASASRKRAASKAELPAAKKVVATAGGGGSSSSSSSGDGNSDMVARLAEFDMDAEILSGLLKNVGGCVSGSLALQAFLDEKWTNYDLDIFTADLTQGKRTAEAVTKYKARGFKLSSPMPLAAKQGASIVGAFFKISKSLGKAVANHMNDQSNLPSVYILPKHKIAQKFVLQANDNHDQKCLSYCMYLDSAGEHQDDLARYK